MCPSCGKKNAVAVKKCGCSHIFVKNDKVSMPLGETNVTAQGRLLRKRVGALNLHFLFKNLLYGPYL